MPRRWSRCWTSRSTSPSPGGGWGGAFFFHVFFVHISIHTLVVPDREPRGATAVGFLGWLQWGGVGERLFRIPAPSCEIMYPAGTLFGPAQPGLGTIAKKRHNLRKTKCTVRGTGDRGRFGHLPSVNPSPRNPAPLHSHGLGIVGSLCFWPYWHWRVCWVWPLDSAFMRFKPTESWRESAGDRNRWGSWRTRARHR